MVPKKRLRKIKNSHNSITNQHKFKKGSHHLMNLKMSLKKEMKNIQKNQNKKNWLKNSYNKNSHKNWRQNKNNLNKNNKNWTKIKLKMRNKNWLWKNKEMPWHWKNKKDCQIKKLFKSNSNQTCRQAKKGQIQKNLKMYRNSVQIVMK